MSPQATTRRVLVAVLTLLTVLGAAPPASAGTPDAGTLPVDAAPVVHPVPREISTTGRAVPLAGTVRLVVGPATEAATVTDTEALLRSAGVARVVRGPAPDARLTLHLATGTAGPATATTLRKLGASGPTGLPAEGYVLAAGTVDGHAHAVLAGVDPTGTWYALQTLRQLLVARPGPDLLPAVTVRDWPATAERGTIEGFYGTPWSHADRLRHLDFAGANKLDTYVYAPKDDPFHRERWREPYPSERLAAFAELAARARLRHVNLVFAVSPGRTVCHADDADFASLTRKAGALYDVGVRSFAIFFDDISEQLACPADRDRFGGDASPVAAAQAHLLNRFDREFVATHPGTSALTTCPTRYAGTDPSPYLDRFADLVAPDVRMMWTGPQVISPTIGDADLAAVHARYRHPVVLWDNYPVNDAQTDRLYLGPVTGRGAHLAANGLRSWLANPMTQAEPSTLALATVADQSWNPVDYEPERSWRRVLRAAEGRDDGVLAAFGDVNRSSPLDPRPAPVLTGRIEAFDRALAAGDPGAAAPPLVGSFTALATAPETVAALDGPLDGRAFVDQAGPWLTKAARYGTAGAAAVRSLVAEDDGDLTTAWRERVVLDREAVAAEELTQSVAPGVVAPFLRRAQAASRVLTLAAPDPAEPLVPGTDVTLRADVRSGTVAVRQVRFLVGDTVVGAATAAPYEVVWRDVPRRLARVVVEATDADGGVVRSAPVDLTVGTPDRALLVYGGDGNPGTGGIAPGERDVVDRLHHLGLAVDLVPAKRATTGDAAGHALVLVSSTVASGDVGAKFRDVPVPVVAWEAFVFDDLGMTRDQGELFRVRSVRFAEPATPLSAGLTGPVAVYRQDGRLRWGVPASTALVAATLPDEPGRAVLFGYERGTPMVTGVAPARRVGLFLGDEGMLGSLVSAETVRVFDAVVTWSVG